MEKTNLIRLLKCALYSLGSLILLIYWAWAVYVHSITPTISKVMITGDHFKTPTKVSFPFRQNSLTRTGLYNFEVTILYNKGDKTEFLITPDDCVRKIQINGNGYKLVSGVNYCGNKTGFIADFGPFLRPGNNSINIAVEDKHGGLYGLDLQSNKPRMPSRLQTTSIFIAGVFLILAGGLIHYHAHIKKNYVALALCLLGTVLFRFPYFWSPAFRDEGAFIMLGRDFLQGNLPYLVTFENKPPLVNVIYAFFLIFTDSLPGVRLMMALYLGITAYVLYRIGNVTGFQRAGTLSALFSLLLFNVPHFSFDRSFRIVYTELLISLPLALTLLFLLKPSKKQSDFLLLGLCCAATALIRTNLIVVAPFVALIILTELQNPFSKRVRQVIWFSVGTIFPFITLVFIYSSVGHLRTLFDSLITAPIAGFEDAGVMLNISEISHVVGRYLNSGKWVLTRIINLWCVPIIGIVIGICFILLQRDWRMITNFLKITVIAIATILSTVILVHHFDHYMLQLVVPIALMAGFAISALMENRIVAFPVMLTIFFALSFLKDNLEVGIRVTNKWGAGEPLQRDAAFKVGEFIRQQDGMGEPFFSYEWGEIPFYTNATLVTMHVFPQINTYEKLNTLLLRKPYSREEQVKEILRKQPRFIAYQNNNIEYDLLVHAAKNQGYFDVIEIDSISLLERP